MGWLASFSRLVPQPFLEATHALIRLVEITLIGLDYPAKIRLREMVPRRQELVAPTKCGPFVDPQVLRRLSDGLPFHHVGGGLPLHPLFLAVGQRGTCQVVESSAASLTQVPLFKVTLFVLEPPVAFDGQRTTSHAV